MSATLLHALASIDDAFSLELNIHQRILTDLAANVAQSEKQDEDGDVALVAETIASRVQTVNIDSDLEDVAPERVYMVRELTNYDHFKFLCTSFRRARVSDAILDLPNSLRL